MYNGRRQISGCLGMGAREAVCVCWGVGEGGGQETKIKKGNEENFRGDGYAPYLDGGDGSMEVYICQNLSV